MDYYAQDPMGGGQPLSGHSKENLISALRQRNDCTLLLAYHDQRAVGLLTAFEGFSTFQCQPLLNIHDVIVIASQRGQGVSRKLFEEIERLARLRGCCKLTLEVLEGNALARAAYQRFGFAGYELDPKMGKALFWEKGL